MEIFKVITPILLQTVTAALRLRQLAADPGVKLVTQGNLVCDTLQRALDNQLKPELMPKLFKMY